MEEDRIKYSTDSKDQHISNVQNHVYIIFLKCSIPKMLAFSEQHISVKMTHLNEFEFDDF